MWRREKCRFGSVLFGTNNWLGLFMGISLVGISGSSGSWPPMLVVAVVCRCFYGEVSWKRLVVFERPLGLRIDMLGLGWWAMLHRRGCCR